MRDLPSRTTRPSPTGVWGPGLAAIAVAGAAFVMLAVAVIEALTDLQRTRYQQRESAERPDVLDTGLWGWSPHPNYLGDSLVRDGPGSSPQSRGPAGGPSRPRWP